MFRLSQFTVFFIAYSPGKGNRQIFQSVVISTKKNDRTETARGCLWDSPALKRISCIFRNGMLLHIRQIPFSSNRRISSRFSVRVSASLSSSLHSASICSSISAPDRMSSKSAIRQANRIVFSWVSFRTPPLYGFCTQQDCITGFPTAAI